MLVGIVVGAGLGLLLVQTTRYVEPHPMGKRNLAYIERIWEPNANAEGDSVVLRMIGP